MTGRPTTYTDEVADAICEHIAHGTSLVRVCTRDDMPAYSTVMKWLTQQAAFAEKYAHARAAQADFLAEQILDISDDDSLDIGFDDEGKPFVKGENIQRSRLKVDARKWYASKLAPKKYGEAVHLGVQPGVKATFTINVGDAGPEDH